MVVLARLTGIPARLAVGYTMGQFDPQRGDYLVTELNAHSWPELYFPEYGWIPFEPTSALAAPERTESTYVPPDWAERMPQELASQMGELRAAATENASSQRRWLVARSISGTACGLLLCLYAAALLWPLTGRARSPIQPGPEGELGAAYDRLLRWGGRLGRPPRPADTPREYAVALASVAAAAAAGARLSRRAAFEAADVVQVGAAALVADYEAALYAPVPLVDLSSNVPAADTVQWAGLWGALRRLWLARLSSKLAARQRSQS
jgi:hypothetical protein